MENREKIQAKRKLGTVVKEILAENAELGKSTITSLRKLAASSGVEYSIIQKIAAGEKDPQFTTLLSVADGLEISLAEIIARFEKVQNDSIKQNKALKSSKKK